MTLSRVRKRDGREVPFDKGKIRAAVLRAQAATEQADDGLAGDVADLVALVLERRFGPQRGERVAGAVPGIEEIQDCVEHALVELGRAAVAKAYILYRDQRARIRAAIAVEAETPATRRRPSVREADKVGAWTKGRIVAALMSEADLPRELAERVASAVEERVFSSGLARISTALIRELVDNELVGLGLERALERHRPVAIARHDLRALLADAGREPEPAATGAARAERRVEDAVSGELLRRFALEEVLDDRLAERHLEGDLHVEDLARPHLCLVEAVPAELLARGSGASAFDILAGIAPLLARVSSGLVIEDVAHELEPLARGRDGDERLSAWLVALGALARAAGRRIDLVPIGAPGKRSSAARARAATARLLEALAGLDAERSGAPPRVLVDARELELLLAETPDARAWADRLLARGTLVPTWSTPAERFAGPGCARLASERGAIACGGAVALNLPRLARRAGPWREDRMLELASEQVDLALGALACLRDFQRAHARGAPSGRLVHALVPVGLREALAVLGDGEVRPEQGARLLGLIDESARSGGRRLGLSCALTPFFGGSARGRFARLDAELFQAEQGLLFRESALGRESPGSREVAYSAGFELAPLNPARAARTPPGSDEGECLATVPVGALHPPLSQGPARAALLRGEELRALAAWTRFEERRTAHRLRHAPTSPVRSAEPELSFDAATAVAGSDDPPCA